MEPCTPPSGDACIHRTSGGAGESRMAIKRHNLDTVAIERWSYHQCADFARCGPRIRAVPNALRSWGRRLPLFENVELSPMVLPIPAGDPVGPNVLAHGWDGGQGTAGRDLQHDKACLAHQFDVGIAIALMPHQGHEARHLDMGPQHLPRGERVHGDRPVGPLSKRRGCDADTEETGEQPPRQRPRIAPQHARPCCTPKRLTGLALHWNVIESVWACWAAVGSFHSGLRTHREPVCVASAPSWNCA